MSDGVSSPPTPVVLGWGLGVESTAILTRWILEPDTRDFDLDQLVVLTALTGDEFAVTHQLVEEHLLPLLRAHGIRWVQVGRTGQADTTGITVVDDSRTARTSHVAGPWRLSDELVAAGTVPQYASGRRLCSIRAKGSVLDRWLAANVAGEFRHVIGFNSGEMARVLRDRSYSSADRQSEYPLIGWDWDRQACLDYLEETFGVVWHKSCCGFCPFRGGSTDEVMIDWDADPEAGIHALLLERRSMALNPLMTLYKKKAAASVVASERPALLASYLARLEVEPHNLIEVRRIIPHAAADPRKKAPGWRAVRVGMRGTKAACEAELRTQAHQRGLAVEVDEYGIARFWEERRTGVLPDLEWMYVVCPGGVASKERPGFDARWMELTQPAPSLFSV